MKRDMDLVRKVLFELENHDERDTWIGDFAVEGVDEHTLSIHLRLMKEAGLIEAQDLSSMQGIRYKPKRLTWQGHEFLETIRSQKVWERTKAKVLEQTGGLALAALQAYALHTVKQTLGIPVD